ncbi:MAG: hypothetical protein PHH73_00105 [Candidatus Rickettsiella isopodorum]|nr:hypothetical protein [Candidatus Rickettsiella isopodorum]
MDYLPSSYQNLMNKYKQSQLSQLPQAQQMLASQQQARGTFTSPISNYGLSNLYNQYLSNLGQKEAELGLAGAEAGQQESQFTRNLGQQESQFGRGLEYQKQKDINDYLQNLKLAKMAGKAQRNQALTQLPINLFSSYLGGGGWEKLGLV